jgi:hypothetical protein
MAASVLGVAGLIGLALVLAGVLNPLLIVPIIVLAAFPLALGVLGKLFANTSPTVDATTGPGVPTSRQASYDPVADPSERGV